MAEGKRKSHKAISQHTCDDVNTPDLITRDILGAT